MEEILSSHTLSKNKRRMVLFFKMAVSLGLIGYLLSKLDFSSLQKLRPDVAIYFIAAALCVLLALWFMTVRWKIVLLLIQPQRYSLALLYRFYLIGGFFSIFIPGAIGGDAMRLYYVSKFYHLSKKLSLLSVFIERIAGLFALGIILMVSLLFNDTVREKLHFGFATIFLSSCGIVAALLIAKYIVNKKVAISYSDMGKILFFSGLGQFGDIFVAFIFSDYLHLDITLLNLMSIMPLVYVATVVPISLGGVGVREGVMAAGMSLYGIDLSDAVMVSFLLYISKVFVGSSGWLLYIFPTNDLKNLKYRK